MKLLKCLAIAVVLSSMIVSCAGTAGAPAVSASAPAVTATMRAPVVVKRVEPAYPAELRREGVEGVVRISGTVPKEGGVLRNARVVSSDDPRLEPLALDAVSRWVWEPGVQDGQTVDVEFTTTVRFSRR